MSKAEISPELRGHPRVPEVAFYAGVFVSCAVAAAVLDRAMRTPQFNNFIAPALQAIGEIFNK